MKFKALPLAGAYLIELERLEDQRGFFARSYCVEEFKSHGLNINLVQCNISFNSKKGTLRGMHFQCEDKCEAKVVRCTMGAIYDVIIDLRPDSPTFKQWLSLELSALNRHMLYVPEHFAHGFQTLEDHTEVFYQMSEMFSPKHSRGVRWNDPAFNIHWPESEPLLISEKDRSYPDFDREPA